MLSESLNATVGRTCHALPKVSACSCPAAFVAAAPAGAYVPSASSTVVKSPAKNIPIPYDFSGVVVNVVTGKTGTDVFDPTDPSFVRGWDLNLYGNSTTFFMAPFDVNPAT